MSYDFCIYSPSEKPVAKEDLKAELEKRGWTVFFAFGGSNDEKIVPPNGPLENGSIIYTCKADDENLPRFLKAAETNDIATLNSMLESYEIDFCGLWWSPFDFEKNYGLEVWEANKSGYSEEESTALQQARTQYSFDVSYEEFYLDVAQAIGDFIGGMLEDPQTGMVEIKEAKA